MNVVMLSDHDGQGGAAVAARRLEAGLNSHAKVSRVVFLADGSTPPHAALWYEESPLKTHLMRLPRRLLPHVFDRPHTREFAGRRLREVLSILAPDVINVHNLHAASPWGWGPRLLDVCLEFAPVVWTLHDMWSFTGRCAYSYGCERFITGCDATCATHDEAPSLAAKDIHAAWEERRSIYERHCSDLFFVTPSRWLASQARRGMLSQHRIEVIPYGVPISPALMPRAEARRRLGIIADGPVLLVAAFDLTERRKGAEIHPHVWPHVDRRQVTVLTMGRGDLNLGDIRVHALGYVDDEDTRTLAYSAADALLHPAPVDNFPNVVLEAMACGTPAIAMPVGGLPELVRPGVTGWLADEATPHSLAKAVNLALADIASGESLRASCRDVVEKEYTLELQATRYRRLFAQLQFTSRPATISTLP
jgi:glycosyltransferase involved in cell wall biosynthesis